VIHIRKVFYFTASAVLVALFSGCSGTAAAPATLAAAVQAGCIKEGMRAPSWVCQPEVADAYGSVGVAEKNGADKAQTIKAALYNGRTEIAKQIQTQVREKLNNYARAVGNSNKEQIDTLYTSIANAVQPKDLYLQEKMQSWTTPSGKVYIHVIALKSSFDAELKKAVILSHMNDQVIWLDFNSEQSIATLEKEFDVQLAKVQSVQVANSFQVERVSDMIVGHNKKH
jgi:hypothetical protein